MEFLSIDPELRDLLPSILRRLPVNSLLRFRCVSKHWLTFIDHPKFIESQLNHARTNRISLFCQPYLDHKPSIPLPYAVMGSSDGTLCLLSQRCLKTETEQKFRVIHWNPSTRKLKELPYLQCAREHPFCTVSFGFGTDSTTTNGFKVAILDICPGSNAAVAFNIFDSRINSWRRIQENPRLREVVHGGCRIASILQLASPLVNGALHWLAGRGQNSIIVAFDLKSERFREFQPPCSLRYGESEVDGPVKYMLHALEGNLCLLRYCIMRRRDGTCTLGSMQIWTLKQYGISDSWHMEVMIRGRSETFPKPLLYSRQRDRILFSWDERFVWYSLRNHRLLAVSKKDLPPFFDAFVVVESLVPVHSDPPARPLLGTVLSDVPNVLM